MKTTRGFHSIGLCGLMVLVLGMSASVSEGTTVVYDFNANDGGFSSTLNTAAFDGPWVYNAGAGNWQTEGQAPEIQHACTTDLTSPDLLLDGPGELILSFTHRYAMEAGNWDGGAVFVSVNGGGFNYVPGSSFTSNGYNGSVLINSASQLLGLEAFVLTSPDHALGTQLTSVANLGSFAAGDIIHVRFRAAYDTNTSGGSPDWEIDNVMLTLIPEPGAMGLVAMALASALLRRSRKFGRP